MQNRKLNLLSVNLVKYLTEKQNVINATKIDLPDTIIQELNALPEFAIELMQAGLTFQALCNYINVLQQQEKYKGKVIHITALMFNEENSKDNLMSNFFPGAATLQRASQYNFDKLNCTHLTEYKYILIAQRFLVDLKVPVETINELTSEDWRRLHGAHLRFNVGLNEFLVKCAGLRNRFKFPFSDVLKLFKQNSGCLEDIIDNFYGINDKVGENAPDRTERWNIFIRWLYSGLNVKSVLFLSGAAGILLADHPIYIDHSPAPISKAVEMLLLRLSENNLTLKGMNLLSDAGKKLIFENISAYLQLKLAGMSDEDFKSLEGEENSATMKIFFKNSETILYLVRELDINFAEIETQTRQKLYERFAKSLSDTSRLYKIYLELIKYFVKSQKFESVEKCLSYIANYAASGAMELSRMIEVAGMIQFGKEVAKVPLQLKETAYNQIMRSILMRYKHIGASTEETILGLAHLLTAYNLMPRVERFNQALKLVASALPHLSDPEQSRAINDIFGFTTTLINERRAINPNEDGSLIDQFEETKKTILTVAGQHDLAIYIATELQRMVMITVNPEAKERYSTLSEEWYSIASLLVKAVEIEKRITLQTTANIEQEANEAIRQQVTERQVAEQVALDAYRHLRRRGVPIFSAVEQVRASSTVVRSLDDDENTSVATASLNRN